MTVTLFDPVRIGPSAWRVRYSSDQGSPVFRAYHRGEMIYQGSREWVDVKSDVRPFVEVLDDADAVAVQEAYPWAVRLSWVSTDASVRYFSVRRDTGGGSYAEIDRVIKDDRVSYLWRSGPYADGSSESFRVVAVTPTGDEGTAAELSLEVVRIPDHPETTLGYTGGEVTISDA